MEQEQSNISNPYLPSLVDSNVFQLIVAGDTSKVKRFWEFLSSSPKYGFRMDHRGYLMAWNRKIKYTS